ncbi:hypothetical protein LQ236_001354 [Nitrospina gracilis]|nr:MULTISPECIES: hypothetical protein [Nitrospina]MCF8723334.1 hypothetical protein [Nitrospina sp. Nb-3]
MIELSFKRLAPISSAGKKPLERTSALMYFLAFDAAVKKLGCCPLDMNPRSIKGKNNRQVMELEFIKLMQLKPSEDKEARHVVVLGKVEKGGTPPEKRISSNFFTVPVKKASESAEACNYPNRPAPLLKMGSAAARIKWGIDYHNDWKTNLPKLLVELKGNTPFTDLAVFVTRNDPIPKDYTKVHEALSFAIRNRFGQDLATFWEKRMDAEKVFVKHCEDPFRSSYSDPLTADAFTMECNGSDRAALKTLDKDVLADRIVYLEGLLDAQDIEYQSITD